MKKILEAVSGKTGISPQDILSRKRDGKTADARGLFMYIARISGHPVKNIAAFVHRSVSNVYRQTNKIKAQARIYKSLSERIEDITRNVGSR
jgi:chromosomal replication initiation ATPase DnaA